MKIHIVIPYEIEDYDESGIYVNHYSPIGIFDNYEDAHNCVVAHNRESECTIIELEITNG